MTKLGYSISRIVLGVGLFAGGSAFAASAPADQTSPAKPEEIVVTGKYTINEQIDTATGLGLTLYETPQSVSVMTSQRIEDQDLRSLTDVVNNAAGVSAKGLDSSRQRFSARGFDIDNYQIDGVPVTWQSGGDAGETQSDMALYERIEIVRGATGLLTGAGNPSASINLVRKHANAREFSGDATVTLGRWNSRRLEVDLGSALNRSGSLRGRTVVVYEDADSFRDFASERKRVVYAVVDADISEQTLLRVGGSRQDNLPEGSTWGGLPVWYSDGSRTDWARSTSTGASWTSWASTVENSYLDVVHDFSNNWRLKLNVNHSVNEADLDLVYLYGVVDKATGNGLGASPRRSDTEREMTSLSAQLSGEYTLFSRQHELTLGVLDSHQNEAGYVSAVTSVPPVGSFYDWDGRYPQPSWGASSKDVDMDTRQAGIYLATRLSVSDAFKVIVGGRVSDWERDGYTFGNTKVAFSESGVWVPYAGALYDLSSRHKLYLSYTEIFQPQNLQDKTGRFLDPILGKSQELGVKSRFFNDALHTTVSVFRIEQDKLGQLDAGETLPGTGGLGQAYYEADGAETQGVELELVGQLADGWDVSFSYTRFTAEDASGEKVNTDQPREMLKLYTTYRFGGVLNKLTVAGGVNWQGDNYTDVDNPVTSQQERLEQKAYILVNMMLRYQFTEQLAAQFNMENALDETYYSQIGFYGQLEYGQPRNYKLSLSYQF